MDPWSTPFLRHPVSTAGLLRRRPGLPELTSWTPPCPPKTRLKNGHPAQQGGGPQTGGVQERGRQEGSAGASAGGVQSAQHSWVTGRDGWQGAEMPGAVRACGLTLCWAATALWPPHPPGSGRG